MTQLLFLRADCRVVEGPTPATTSIVIFCEREPPTEGTRVLDPLSTAWILSLAKVVFGK